jgi:hypothetical protein
VGPVFIETRQNEIIERVRSLEKEEDLRAFSMRLLTDEG